MSMLTKRMIAAHQLGIRDFLAGLEPIVPITLTTQDERDSYIAGYRGAKRRVRVSGWIRSIMCEECGKNPADLPSRICPGCQAYREHQQ